MNLSSHTWRVALALAALVVGWSAPAAADPVVVPTAEGQIGETAGPSDKVEGVRFESIRGQAGELLFGGIVVAGGAMPPPPEFEFFKDRIHGSFTPVEVGSSSGSFDEASKVAPAASRSRNAADSGDFVAFSFALDGSASDTMTVRLATFDESGSQLVGVPVALDTPTFMFPDPIFAKTGIAVDDQGRVTVAYTEFDMGSPRVEAVRLNGSTGASIDASFAVTGTPRVHPDIALLDPAGNRLIVVTNDLGSPPAIKGNVIDFTGPSPVVLPDFTVNTTVPGFGTLNPAVAADRATGAFQVVWESLTDASGNPVDVRARRFDAMGNPVGNDFVVNTTTADSQGQPAVAIGPGGESVIVWAGDAGIPGFELDVFAQAYDAMGNPIGGEIKVNTTKDDVQDRPDVRFLPELDAQGRSQFTVVWRDVGVPDGSSPRGTGRSFKCFSIGSDVEAAIFADGFESGDTASWSTKVENP